MRSELYTSITIQILSKTDIPKFKIFMPLAVDIMPTDVSVTLFSDSTV